MDIITEFNKKIDYVEKLENLEEKTENVKKIKEEIKLEKEKVEKLIEKISNSKSKKQKKYKGISLDNLLKMYNEEENFDIKIEIFQQINHLIELTKNQLFEE